MTLKIDRITILSLIIGVMICDPIHFLFVKVFTGGAYYLLVVFGLIWVISKMRLTDVLQRNMFMCFCAFALLMTFYYQIFSTSDIRGILGLNIHGYVLYYLESFFALCVYFFIENSCDDKIKKRLKKAIIMFLLINSIITICACLIDPNISRTNAMGVVKRASQNQSDSVLTGLASTYSFAAEMCVLVPFILAERKKDKRAYFIVALMLVCTVMMGFTIMTLCFLIAIAVFFIYQSVEKKHTIVFILLIALFIVVFFNIDSLLYTVIRFLKEYYPNTTYIEKLSDMYDYLVYGTKGLAITGRMINYTNGIQSFLNHPFFGNVITETAGAFKISGHSSILDIFSLWGVVFGMPFILFMHYLNKEMKYSLPLRIQAPVFITLILVFSLNPTVQYCHIWFAVFIAIATYGVDRNASDEVTC